MCTCVLSLVVTARDSAIKEQMVVGLRLLFLFNCFIWCLAPPRLVVGGGITNFTDVAATFNVIIRALKEKESKLKASRMHIYVSRGGPNYQKGLAKMRALGEEIGIRIEVYGPEKAMTGICK
ncbi:ATP citrate synthase [Heracleum sosnowskyi]|uniref:ATP citrate synthase n=1 Tax=Heracleum sosnowskyi TaxID=360622 RepID=A0AAD8LXX9_9APIA|nr:ATP citrate synthase [Heracleum sosnowskyi]